MTGTLIGYARCSTDKQDLTAQIEALAELGVASTLTRVLPAQTAPGLAWIRPWPRCERVTPWWCQSWTA